MPNFLRLNYSFSFNLFSVDFFNRLMVLIKILNEDKVYKNYISMRKITDSIKKVFGRFDDSLINPPK